MLKRIAPVIVLGLAFVSTAQAAQRHPMPVVRLDRVVRRLRTDLRHARRVRVDMRVRLTASQRQITTVRAELAQATTKLTSEQAQVTALQAELAATPAPATPAAATPAPTPPSPLDIAVQQVRQEVAYAEGVLGSTPYSYGQLISQAAMDYVVGHVSAPAYGYLTTTLHQTLSPTPDAILGAQAGICGDAALTFAAIVKRFGFDVRSVQFYYGPNGSWNHIADEVNYDGGWHYFDPTFGIDYMQNGVALSITDARAATDPASLVQKDSTLFWTAVTTQAGDTELSDTSFATDPATTVTLDQQPFDG